MPRQHAELRISAADFQSEKLDNHLQFLIQVVDDTGNTIGTGRSVELLKQQLGGSESPADDSISPDKDDESWSRESMTAFDIDVLPKETIRNRGGVQVAQYPGLVD